MTDSTAFEWPRGFSKPNLFVIGASKSGTSSLHEYLALHPEISMSRVKETNFFLEPSIHDASIVPASGSAQTAFELYLSLSPSLATSRYAGESTPGYTWFPHFKGVPQRLSAFNPSARLIYLVRDPVERAISHYWYWCMLGSETRPPLQAFQDNAIYRDVSNYALQLQQYLEVFPRDQIYVCTLEDLAARPLDTMTAIFEWLDLPFPGGVSEDSFRKRENETPGVVRRPRRGLTALRKSTLFKHLRILSPAPIRRTVWNLLGKCDVDRKQTDMSASTRFLQDCLQPQAAEFEQLCGISFGQWRTVWNSSISKNRAASRVSSG